MLHERFQFAHKGRDVCKLPVYGRIADVSDLVDSAKPLHNHFADTLGRDLLLERVVDLLFDILDEFVDLGKGNGPLFARFYNAVFDLVRVESLPRPVVFDDEHGGRFDCFIRCEAPAALHTLAPSAYGASLVRGTAVNDLAFRASAIHTFHKYFLRYATACVIEDKYNTISPKCKAFVQILPVFGMRFADRAAKR